MRRAYKKIVTLKAYWRCFLTEKNYLFDERWRADLPALTYTSWPMCRFLGIPRVRRSDGSG